MRSRSPLAITRSALCPVLSYSTQLASHRKMTFGLCCRQRAQPARSICASGDTKRSSTKRMQGAIGSKLVPLNDGAPSRQAESNALQWAAGRYGAKLCSGGGLEDRSPRISSKCIVDCAVVSVGGTGRGICKSLRCEPLRCRCLRRSIPRLRSPAWQTGESLVNESRVNCGRLRCNFMNRMKQ